MRTCTPTSTPDCDTHVKSLQISRTGFAQPGMVVTKRASAGPRQCGAKTRPEARYLECARDKNNLILLHPTPPSFYFIFD